MTKGTPESVPTAFSFEQGRREYRCEVDVSCEFEVFDVGRAEVKIGNGSLNKCATGWFVANHSQGIDEPMVHKIQLHMNGLDGRVSHSLNDCDPAVRYCTVQVPVPGKDGEMVTCGKPGVAAGQAEANSGTESWRCEAGHDFFNIPTTRRR
jgi:hypothetical protein